MHKSGGALTEDIWCARKHRRAPARGRVHLDRVAYALCCRENVVSSFRQERDINSNFSIPLHFSMGQNVKIVATSDTVLEG